MCLNPGCVTARVDLKPVDLKLPQELRRFDSTWAKSRKAGNRSVNGAFGRPLLGPQSHLARRYNLEFLMTADRTASTSRRKTARTRR